METWLAWGVLGLVLVIAELLTGTFYLLMLGIAAFGAAAAAGLGLVFAAQAVIACVVAADFESWIDSGARLARVRYRGAGWDARVEGAEALEPGATVYVLAADGNTLKVSKTRPA